MSSRSVYDRQMRVLCDRAKWADHRTDLSAKLDVGETLDTDRATDAISDKKPQPGWMSELAYDLNHLVELGYLRVVYERQLDVSVPEGQLEDLKSFPFVRLTAAGVEHVHQIERGLLRRAFDKQPATAVGIVLVLLQLAIAAYTLLG